MANEVDNHGQVYKKPSVGACIGGFLVGSVANIAISGVVSNVAGLSGGDALKKMDNTLTADEFSSIDKAINKTLDSSGLSKKGVSIIKATSKNIEEVDNIVYNEMNSDFFTKNLYPKFLKKNISKSLADAIRNGKNALHAKFPNKLIFSAKGPTLPAFHEVGHALNYTLGSFSKMLRSSRSAALLLIPITWIALLKNKKAPNQEPSGAVDKTTTFIKNNAGKLAFLAFVPAMLEEGIASFKGNKIAKQLLKPELAKKVAKTNIIGFLTYLALAIGAGLGIYTGTKVRDSIAKPKLVTQEKN